jgi:hypothetical protein
VEHSVPTINIERNNMTPIKTTTKKKLIFDIEGNGFIPELENIWMLVAHDVDDGTKYQFSDHAPHLPSMDYAIELLDSATMLGGHNVFGYDFGGLKKIYGWELPFEKKVVDTWILSMLNRYKRTHAHGLAGWGEKLGFAKGEFSDWEGGFSQKMLTYCDRDVGLNVLVYHELAKEAAKLSANNPLYRKRIEVEMYVARLNGELNDKGWVFDKALAEKTLAEINVKMEKTEKLVEPAMGYKTVLIDKAPKTAKYTKKGWYNSVSARLLSEYLGKRVLPEDALLEEPPIKVGEEFQRSKQEKILMGNVADVKDHLQSIGWKPDEWNFSKMPNGHKIKTSAKLEGETLKDLGQIGVDVKKYYMLRQRRSSFEGFLKMEAERGDGRVSGNMWTLGTASMRVRHERIVNLPKNNGKVPYGLEIRSLFKCEEGYKVVGCDSAGNQLRGFCHTIKNDAYTQEVITSDAHQNHANMLGITRDKAKVFIYRLLFGTTSWGLSFALDMTEPEAADIMQKYSDKLPEFGDTVTRLENEWKSRNGWIFGESGCILFCDDIKNVLNTYLQDIEKMTCANAMYWSHKKLIEEEIDFYPAIFYHDEDAFVVREDQAERAGEILKEGFVQGPAEFGIDIMAGGDYCIGDSYADVH